MTINRETLHNPASQRPSCAAWLAARKRVKRDLWDCRIALETALLDGAPDRITQARTDLRDAMHLAEHYAKTPEEFWPDLRPHAGDELAVDQDVELLEVAERCSLDVGRVARIAG